MTPSIYAMVMHLSQYATSIIPVAGELIPIAMWVYVRDQNELVNEDDQDLMNFFIFYYVIYITVAVVLYFVAIGLILLTTHSCLVPYHELTLNTSCQSNSQSPYTLGVDILLTSPLSQRRSNLGLDVPPFLFRPTAVVANSATHLVTIFRDSYNVHKIP